MKKFLSILGILIVLYLCKDVIIYIIKLENPDYYVAYKAYAVQTIHEEGCYKARIKKDICELYDKVLRLKANAEGLELIKREFSPYEMEMGMKEIDVKMRYAIEEVLNNTSKERIITELHKDKTLCSILSRVFIYGGYIDKSEFNCNETPNILEKTDGLMDDIRFLIFMFNNKR